MTLQIFKHKYDFDSSCLYPVLCDSTVGGE